MISHTSIFFSRLCRHVGNMERSKSDSNRKRSQETNVQPTEKRTKAETSENVSSVSTAVITNVNANCLALIFEKLDLADLLNVADSSKVFKEAVGQAFMCKYGKKEVVTRDRVRLNGTEITIDENQITISGPPCLKLLRSFGHLITKLHYFQSNHKSSSRMDRYIAKYCAASLVVILFARTTRSLAKIMYKPYPEAKIVKFEDCKFRGRSPDINYTFPSISHLILGNFKPLINIQHNFSNLAHFEIDHRNYTKAQSLEFGATLVNFMKLNPQLRNLCLRNSYSMIDANVISAASECLESLERFEFAFSHNSFDARMIQFKNVREARMYYTAANREGLPHMPLLFHELEYLEFQFLLNTNLLTEHFFEFLKKHPKILKLKLINPPAMTETDQMNLTQAVPLLTKQNRLNNTMTLEKLEMAEAHPFRNHFEGLRGVSWERHIRTPVVGRLPDNSTH